MSRPLALISGGTQGIGLAVAQELLPDHDLALIYKSRPDLAEEALAKLRALSSAAIVKVYASDVADFAATERTYRKIKSDFSRAPNVLVCSAGRASSALALLEKIENYQEIMAINYFGVVYLCKLVAPDMIRARGGRIVNLSSATVANNTRGHSAYSSSKAAMEKFSFILGGELAKYGITVNTVRPWVVLTKMTRPWLDSVSSDPAKYASLVFPSGQLTEMPSVTKAVRFFVESPQVNCTSLTVDGGNANFIDI